MKRLHTFALTASILAVTSSLSFAQVREVVGGRALDASPQVGSGGSNSPVPGYVPINPNDIITGNVSGLNYFHGSAGTASPYTFRGNLGSASLNNFTRTTAGGIQMSPGGSVNQI